MSKGIFIVGTDTNIGKTLVSAWLIAHFSFSYWKPIQCGKPTDSSFIRNILAKAKIFDELYVSYQATSPHIAFKNEPVEMNRITQQSEKIGLQSYLLKKLAIFENQITGISPFENEILNGNNLNDHKDLHLSKEIILIESAGGILSPLNEKESVIDIAKTLGLPIIIVSHGLLGGINQAKMAVHIAKDYGVEIFGIILSGNIEDDNDHHIEKLTEIPVLDLLPKMNVINYQSLMAKGPSQKLKNIIQTYDIIQK